MTVHRWLLGTLLCSLLAGSGGGPPAQQAPQSAGPAPALALKAFGAQVPTVFVIIADPVRLGLAQSLGRPGGNFTGLATMAPDLFLSKQIELLREIVPKARRIAYLLNPDNPVHVQGRELREKVLAAQKLTLIQLQARTKEGLEAAFVEAAKQKAEMMYVGGDLLPMSNRELVAKLAIKHRLPTMFLFYEHVEAGGLISYGIDRAELVRQSAAYIDKILKGASPRDLPIEEPAKYVLMVNLKTAKALGVTVPQTVLLRADKVIE